MQQDVQAVHGPQLPKLINTLAVAVATESGAHRPYFEGRVQHGAHRPYIEGLTGPILRGAHGAHRLYIEGLTGPILRSAHGPYNY